MLRYTLRKTIIVVALALYLCLHLISVADAGNQERAGLRILYAGVLDTDRAKDFVAFLGEHFEQVETTDYVEFTSDKSEGFDVPENGSQIGYLQPPYAEQTIVHGGAQSMPYFYDNTPGYSEASMTLNSYRDWIMYGVQTLSLWFHGDRANASEPMYASIANTQQTPAVIYHEDPGAPQTNDWTQWVIDLKAFFDQGVDLTDIDKLSIGFGDKYNRQVGGTGLMFFDDIRLYRPPEQMN